MAFHVVLSFGYFSGVLELFRIKETSLLSLLLNS